MFQLLDRMGKANWCIGYIHLNNRLKFLTIFGHVKCLRDLDISMDPIVVQQLHDFIFNSVTGDTGYLELLWLKERMGGEGREGLVEV